MGIKPLLKTDIMKASTFKNRTKEFTSNSKGYQLANELLTTGKTVRTCWTSGRGRFCKNMLYTEDTEQVLKAAGLKSKDYEVGNDSPRGGKTGDFIKLTSSGKKKMIK